MAEARLGRLSCGVTLSGQPTPFEDVGTLFLRLGPPLPLWDSQPWSCHLELKGQLFPGAAFQLLRSSPN